MTDGSEDVGCGPCAPWVDTLDAATRAGLEAFTERTLDEVRDAQQRLGDLWAFLLERSAPTACLREVEMAFEGLRDAEAFVHAAVAPTTAGR